MDMDIKMGVKEIFMRNRPVIWSIHLGLILGLLTTPPHLAYAETRPCRGFSGAIYSRERLRAICGEPDEILEQETRRVVLWRYKGYPYVVVRGGHDIEIGVPTVKARSTTQKKSTTGLAQGLFLSILDEAVSVSE
jgi:hypothetical protein